MSWMLYKVLLLINMISELPNCWKVGYCCDSLQAIYLYCGSLQL